MLMFLEINNKFDQILKVSLGAFMFILPLIYVRAFLYQGISSRFVVFSILIELLAVVFAIFLFKKETRLVVWKSPIVLAIALYGIMYVVCSMAGVDPLVSFWSKAARMTGIFFLLHLIVYYFFLVYLFFKDEVFKNKLFLTISISGAVFSFLSFLSPEGINILFKKLVTDGFTIGNSTFAGMYVFITFVISIYLLYKKENRRNFWYWVMPVIMLLNPFFLNNKFWYGQVNLLDPLSLVGEARASVYSIFGFIVFTLVAFFILKIKEDKKRNLGITIVSLVTLLSSAFVVFSLISPNGYVREKYLSQATSARPLVWELSEKAVKERPLLGWGPDNFDMAYDTHYDNRLLEQRYGNEPWFDRAHNIVIDQTVDTGYVGLVVYLLVYLTILFSLLYIARKANDEETRFAGVLLFGYFVFHFLEIQTAFETITSFILIALLLAWITAMLHKVMSENISKNFSIIFPEWLKVLKGVGLIVVFFIAFIFGTAPITKSEAANGKIRTIGDSNMRLGMYDSLFATPVDLPSFIWRMSTDFQRGIADDPSILADPDINEGLKKEVERYATEYENYLMTHPGDYRATLNLADQYLYLSLFGGDRVDDAQKVLDKALVLSPENPQTYWMKSVAYLYKADFANARIWADKGIAVNPNIEESQELKDYIETSIKEFPDVTLFFFRSL